MKNKLTLEHLSAYLPYEVKFISEMDKPYDEYGTQPIWTLNGEIEMFSEYCLITKESIDAYPISKCKLRLRPLSQLTREIEHKGERFVPYERIKELYSNTPQFTEYKENWLDVYGIMSSKCEYVCVLKLLEWHFDVFGLIDKCLAIDINTLKY